MFLVTEKCELKFKKTKYLLMFLFLGYNRDNLEHIKKKLSDIEEKLDTYMNRLTLEEKKLRMEGKIYFFSGGGGDN